MIDICDLAEGQSRQLYGLTIASERLGGQNDRNVVPHGSGWDDIDVHLFYRALMLEHGVGLGVPRLCDLETLRKTPLTAMACKIIFDRAVERFGDDASNGLHQLVIGGADVGGVLVEAKDAPALSATDSTLRGAIGGRKVEVR